MKKFVLALMVLIGGVAAYNQLKTETAIEFFTRYHAVVSEGRSFEEDAAFQASARRAAVQASLQAAEDGGEGLKTAYLELTQEQARCSELSLSEETQNGAVVMLVFDVEDVCGTYSEGATVKEIIELVEEDGDWKILSNTTSVNE